MRIATSSTLVFLLTGLALTPHALSAAPPPQEQETAGDEAEDTTTAYSDVITEDAVTSEGLFDTHMIDRDLFYEIPLDMIGREMLLLTRIARTPDGAGYGGSKVEHFDRALGA